MWAAHTNTSQVHTRLQRSWPLCSSRPQGLNTESCHLEDERSPFPLVWTWPSWSRPICIYCLQLQECWQASSRRGRLGNCVGRRAPLLHQWPCYAASGCRGHQLSLWPCAPKSPDDTTQGFQEDCHLGRRCLVAWPHSRGSTPAECPFLFAALFHLSLPSWQQPDVHPAPPYRQLSNCLCQALWMDLHALCLHPLATPVAHRHHFGPCGKITTIMPWLQSMLRF